MFCKKLCREIGSDRFLNGSVRVMAGCYITGQAAGKAVAVSIKKNIEVRKIKMNYNWIRGYCLMQDGTFHYCRELQPQQVGRKVLP